VADRPYDQSLLTPSVNEYFPALIVEAQVDEWEWRERTRPLVDRPIDTAGAAITACVKAIWTNDHNFVRGGPDGEKFAIDGSAAHAA
jgi:hypothetical protein